MAYVARLRLHAGTYRPTRGDALDGDLTQEMTMKKLLIAATLSAAALAAAPLLAQQTGEKKGVATAADCPMANAQGNRADHRAEMHKRMEEMHARMGARETRERDGEHEHQH